LRARSGNCQFKDARRNDLAVVSAAALKKAQSQKRLRDEALFNVQARLA
jgi:hypothetical protein